MIIVLLLISAITFIFLTGAVIGFMIGHRDVIKLASLYAENMNAGQHEVYAMIRFLRRYLDCHG